MSDIKVFHEDDYKVFDKLMNSSTQKIGVLGWVKAYLNDRLVVDKPNLVVAKGREFVAQRIFGMSRTGANWASHKITHFGVGSGGVTLDGMTVNLNGPHSCDTGLYKPITLGVSSYLTDPSNYDGGATSPINKATLALKPITTDGSITMEEVDHSSSGTTCKYYSRVKCVCKIPSGEPYDLQPSDSVPITEAALYFTSGSNVQMFSHICFAPKWKEKESNFTIEWYIVC